MLGLTLYVIVAKDNTYDKIILGIDPGTNIAGYGVIGIKKNQLNYISMGIFDLRSEINHAMKLQSIFDKCSKLIDTYLPDEFAIEAPFYGKNAQSMLKLGRAQGVSMAVWCMGGTFYQILFPSPMFHNINFTTSWPRCITKTFFMPICPIFTYVFT